MVYFNFLYVRGVHSWLGSGQVVYQRLKSAVGRKIENLNKERKQRTMQDLTNKLIDARKTEQRLQKQVVEKDKVIDNVNSMYTSCRKKMLKHGKKLKATQEKIQKKDQVGVHTHVRAHSYIIAITPCTHLTVGYDILGRE